jgi:hypothetical protein
VTTNGRIVVLPLNAEERSLVARAVSELVTREGVAAPARSVLKMLRRPLADRDLLALREGAEA